MKNQWLQHRRTKAQIVRVIDEDTGEPFFQFLPGSDGPAVNLMFSRFTASLNEWFTHRKSDTVSLEDFVAWWYDGYFTGADDGK